MKDIQRLARAETMRLRLNWQQYQLPSAFRRDLNALYTAIPESLSTEPTNTKNQLTVFYSVENMPDLQNGIRSLQDAVDYPTSAKKNEIEGVVHVGFVVHPDSSTSHLQIKKPAHPLLTAEALQAIKRLTYEPGTYRGRPVPVWMTLPVRFYVK